jgi:tetratricopeptide (TPR) repeat protein
MVELDSLKEAVDESTKLWRAGQTVEALRLLEERIARAKRENRDVWVKTLSMHASLISDAIGDLPLTRQYCEQVLAYEPENALALSNLADVLFRQGETNLAKRCAAKSYALLAHSNTKEDRGLLELLNKKWPEVHEWQG